MPNERYLPVGTMTEMARGDGAISMALGRIAVMLAAKMMITIITRMMRIEII